MTWGWGGLEREKGLLGNSANDGTKKKGKVSNGPFHYPLLEKKIQTHTQLLGSMSFTDSPVFQPTVFQS